MARKVTTLEELSVTDRTTLTLKEVSDLSGVGYRALTQDFDAGRVPGEKIGNRRYIPTKWVQRFLLTD